MSLALMQALGAVLPSDEQTRMLRVVLSSGGAAARAWQDFREACGDPLSLLARDVEARRLAPLLYASLRRNALLGQSRSQTVLRAAFLREELRAAEFRRVLDSVIRRLHDAGIRPVLAGGVAAAEHVYDQPALRHSHAVELLVADGDLDAAADRLERDATPLRSGPGPTAGLRVLLHRSEVPIRLRTRLFELPHYDIAPEAVRAASLPVAGGGVPLRVPAAAHALVERCLQAPGLGSEALLWPVDACLLLRRMRPSDWEAYEAVFDARWAPPLSVTFEYLGRALGAPVPDDVLARLRSETRRVGAEGRDAALLWARLGARGHRRVLRRVRGAAARARLVTWLLFPSPAHVRRMDGLRGGGFPAAGYVRRLSRWLARRVTVPARHARGSLRCV